MKVMIIGSEMGRNEELGEGILGVRCWEYPKGFPLLYLLGATFFEHDLHEASQIGGKQ